MIIFAVVFPLSLGGANIVLGLMLMLWLAERDFQRKWLILKQEKIVWIFLAIGVLTLLSALFSETLTHSFLAGEKKSLLRVIFSHYILLPFIVVIFITSIQKKFTKWIISAFLTSMFFSEVISYLIFFNLIDVTALKAKHLLYHLASSHDPTPFMHHTEYSVFLSIASILLLHQILHTKNRFIQFFMIIFLISATSNLFMNGGRTGQISYILALSTYMLTYFKLNIKTLLGTGMSLAIVLFLAYQFSPNFQKRSQLALQNIEGITKGNYSSSWGLRVASAKVTLDYLTSSPQNFILGAGAGDCREVYLNHAKTHFSKNISEPIKILAHLHNQYLEYWMDGTVLSLLLFLFFFVLLLKLPLPSSTKPLLLAFIIIVLFACSTDVPMFRYQPSMLFFLMSSYFIVISRKSS
jgi:O-antigen ligase